MIVATRIGVRAFFLFGFAKNEGSNITKTAEEDFKDAAQVYQGLSEDDLALAIRERIFNEIER